MGIFQDMVEVVNRAPVKLRVTFDGQSTDVEPGLSSIPRVTLPFAMNQNPRKGTQDMYNPHISGAEYLIVPNRPNKFNIEPLTKEEWEDHCSQVSRYDYKTYFEDKLDKKNEKVVVRGKGKTQARSRHETGVATGHREDFGDLE